MPYKKRSSRLYRKKRVVRKRRYARKRVTTRLPNRMTGNYASATEQISIVPTAGIPYTFTTRLTDFSRTQAIAKEYQQYRITGIEMRFKPQFTVHQGAGPTTLPSIYWLFNKTGSLNALSASDFEALGTRQVRFDKGILVRKYKPTVTDNATNPIMAGSYKTSPWLPIVNPQTGGLNVPTHYGACFLITKMNPADATQYDVDVVVHIQYKRPFVETQNTPNEVPRVLGNAQP